MELIRVEFVTVLCHGCIKSRIKRCEKIEKRGKRKRSGIISSNVLVLSSAFGLRIITSKSFFMYGITKKHMLQIVEKVYDGQWMEDRQEKTTKKMRSVIF